MGVTRSLYTIVRPKIFKVAWGMVSNNEVITRHTGQLVRREAEK